MNYVNWNKLTTTLSISSSVERSRPHNDRCTSFTFRHRSRY